MVPKSFRRRKRQLKHEYDCEQYRNLSDEEKEEKCQYGRERYKNLEDEYRKFFSRMEKGMVKYVN